MRLGDALPFREHDASHRDPSRQGDVDPRPLGGIHGLPGRAEARPTEGQLHRPRRHPGELVLPAAVRCGGEPLVFVATEAHTDVGERLPVLRRDAPAEGDAGVQGDLEIGGLGFAGHDEAGDALREEALGPHGEVHLSERHVREREGAALSVLRPGGDAEVARLLVCSPGRSTLTWKRTTGCRRWLSITRPRRAPVGSRSKRRSEAGASAVRIAPTDMSSLTSWIW